MNILLDTNIWLWWSIEPRKLSSEASASIETADSIFFSLSSFWEICIKAHKENHNLPLVKEEVESFRLTAVRNGMRQLDITPELCFQASQLPTHHSDPFDRLIIATAQNEDLVVLSTDRKFLDYDIKVVR